METDFSALASRIAASSDDVLGCLILSADGVVLGTFPPVDDATLKPAWLRFAALGTPKRGFIQMSQDELWAYASSGAYAAFAVATGNTRPGVLLDYLEQALMVASESRDRRDVVQPPKRVDLSDTQPLQPVTVAAPSPEAAAEERFWMEMGLPSGSGVAAGGPGPSQSQAHYGVEGAGGQVPEPKESPRGPSGRVGEAEAASRRRAGGSEESEVDRVALAREFAGLLQEDGHGVEEGS